MHAAYVHGELALIDVLFDGIHTHIHICIHVHMRAACVKGRRGLIDVLVEARADIEARDSIHCTYDCVFVCVCVCVCVCMCLLLRLYAYACMVRGIPDGRRSRHRAQISILGHRSHTCMSSICSMNKPP